jgi:hypothetical protein
VSSVEAAVLALVLAALIVAARSKPVRRAVGGVISKDSKGRTTLVIWPAGKKRKRK